MRRVTLSMALAGAAAMASSLMEMTERGFVQRRPRPQYRPLRGTGREPYHVAGRDAVLMDWELPKSKRARRRARGRRS